MFRSYNLWLTRIQTVIKNSALNLANQVERVSSPIVKKCEGTVLERAGTFLKNVGIDYKEVFTETYERSKTSPMKFAIYAGVVGMGAYCAMLNPDENGFRDELLSSQQKIMLLSETVCNPVPLHQLKLLEKHYNEGRIRTFSLGIVTFMWLDDHDSGTALYDVQCDFLKPTVISYISRVIDIGFLGKWWFLSRYMTDYDVNPEEFEGRENISAESKVS